MLSSRVEKTVLGWMVSGTLQAGSESVHNLQLEFYIRDSSGLLRDSTDAFPGELGTIAAGSQIAFESFPTDDEFDDYELFMSFIEGVGPANSLSALQAKATSEEERRSARWLAAKQVYRLARARR